MIKLVIIIFCLLSLTIAQDQGDLVDPSDLPIQFIAKPFYAGYLPISKYQTFYYVYYPSERNPDKDPLVVRISSGPGCSSLYSFVYSKGPFIFKPNTQNITINEHNWNKQANILFLEGPGGVGYAKGDSEGMEDFQFAALNFIGILFFYEKFPQLRDQDIYLTGEQYAGITIPQIALLITEINNDPTIPIWQKLKFKGFLLENPCTLGDQCDSHFEFSRYQMQYLERHYFISRQKYEEYSTKCAYPNPECEKIRIQIEDNFIKTGSDIRNIYKECLKQAGVPQYYKCMDLIGAFKFYNSYNVKEDMHVDYDAPEWQLCNFTVMNSYQRDPLGSYHIYQKLLQEQKQLKIWIVSGSLSASVPIVGTRKWIQDLKTNLRLEITRPWQSWKYDQDINAGQIQQTTKLTFITVRSAGQHLYIDQPEIGYHIYDSFINGKNL